MRIPDDDDDLENFKFILVLRIEHIISRHLFFYLKNIYLLFLSGAKSNKKKKQNCNFNK